jgi:hypothetical protein
VAAWARANYFEDGRWYAATVSYSHMYLLAARAGEGWRAWLEPLSVDGLLVGSSLILYVRQRSSWLTWASVFLGILVSLAANLAAAQPELVSRLVAAWPAVALALSYETLLTLVRQAGDQQKQARAVEEVPVPGDDLVARARALVVSGPPGGRRAARVAPLLRVSWGKHGPGTACAPGPAS